jgi:biotin synthase
MEEIDNIVESASSLLAAEDVDPENQICVSLGQLDTSALRRLCSAGFCRYHHNLETSERFYSSICTTQRWQDRRATVDRVKDLGWSVCSGGLFGLGETWEDRLQLALTLQKLEVDSVPINFFTPISGTPLADRPVLSSDEALRIVALFRLTLPKATIRICGGRPTIQERGGMDPSVFTQQLLRAGANALMTGNFLTTSGISPEKDREIIGARLIP